MRERLKNYKLYMETIFPVHIGGGEMMDRLDYVIVDDDLLLIDYDALVGDTSKRSVLISALSQLLTGQCSPPAMSQYSAVVKRLINEREDFVKFRMPISTAARNGLTANGARGVGEVWLMPSGPMGYYVPGSSIKGAIRTALIDSWITPQERQGHVAKRRRLVSEINSTGNRKMFKELEGMSDLIIKPKAEFFDGGHNYFRNLRISDVYVDKECLCIDKVVRKKRKLQPENSNRNEIPNYIQMIKAETEMAVDFSILDGNSDKISAKTVFDACARYYGPRLKKVFHYDESRQFCLNLGRFAGAENKTFDDLCSINVIPPNKRKETPYKIESEAKTISEIADEELPLGWVLCSIEPLD